MSLSYAEYLRSEHWAILRKKRLAIQPCCGFCNGNHKIHVHHIRYRNYTDCTVADLFTLCERCHDNLHYCLKNNGIENKQLEGPDIIETLKKFKTTPEGIKRDERAQRKSTIRQSKRTYGKAFKSKDPKLKKMHKSIKNLMHQCRKSFYSDGSLKALYDFLKNKFKDQHIHLDTSELDSQSKSNASGDYIIQSVSKNT